MKQYKVEITKEGEARYKSTRLFEFYGEVNYEKNRG